MNDNEAKQRNLAALSSVTAMSASVAAGLAAMALGLLESVPRSDVREARVRAALGLITAMAGLGAVMVELMSGRGVEEVLNGWEEANELVAAAGAKVAVYIEAANMPGSDAIRVEFENLRELLLRDNDAAEANAEVDAKVEMYKRAKEMADASGGEVEFLPGVIHVKEKVGKTALPPLTKKNDVVS